MHAQPLRRADLTSPEPRPVVCRLGLGDEPDDVAIEATRAGHVSNDKDDLREAANSGGPLHATHDTSRERGGTSGEVLVRGSYAADATGPLAVWDSSLGQAPLGNLGQAPFVAIWDRHHWAL